MKAFPGPPGATTSHQGMENQVFTSSWFNSHQDQLGKSHSGRLLGCTFTWVKQGTASVASAQEAIGLGRHCPTHTHLSKLIFKILSNAIEEYLKTQGIAATLG